VGAQSTGDDGGLPGAERGRTALGGQGVRWGKATRRGRPHQDRQSGQSTAGLVRWTGLPRNEHPGWRACSRGNAAATATVPTTCCSPGAVHEPGRQCRTGCTNHPIRWRRSWSWYTPSVVHPGLDVCSTITARRLDPSCGKHMFPTDPFLHIMSRFRRRSWTPVLRQAGPLRRSAAISSQTTLCSFFKIRGYIAS
jgi:hypothetical protein